MKRLSTVAVAGLLVLVLVAAVSGCGGDTKQAQEYTKEADALAKQVEDGVNAIPDKVSSAFANVADPAQFAAGAEEITAFLEDVKKDADKAIAEFEKVESLNGVDDYKKYADLWTQILDIAKKTVDKMVAFIGQAVNLVNTGDAAGLTTLQSSYDTDINDLIDQITSLEEEANQLKSDKNL